MQTQSGSGCKATVILHYLLSQGSNIPMRTTRRIRRRQPCSVRHASLVLSVCLISSLLSNTTSFVSSPHQPHYRADQRYPKRNSYEYVFDRASAASQYAKQYDVSCSSIPDDLPRSARSQHSATNTNANRRDFVFASARAAATIATGFALVDPDPALADPFTQRTGEQLYVLSGKRNKNSTSFLDISGIGDGRSVEECLLKLLPVQNRAYKSLQRQLVDAVAPIKSKSAEAAASPDATEVSIARSVDDKTWRNSLQSMTKALKYFNDQRSRLEPLFNENDTTEMTVMKSERGEQVIGKLRDGIQSMLLAVQDRNITAVVTSQRKSLFALAETGELLVVNFPYDVPTNGKFANLPRLQGRTRVTFTMKRGNAVLGNVTIVADGFAAPITAGNFVDLSARQFYTGLPIKAFRKKLGIEALESSIDETVVQKDAGELLEKTISNFNAKFGTNVLVEEADDEAETITTSIPIWGSYQEGVSLNSRLALNSLYGLITSYSVFLCILLLTHIFAPQTLLGQFYDPLTAKPRRIPLEIVQEDESGKGFKLAYAGGFAKLPTNSKIQDNMPLAKPSTSRPYRAALTFDTPGLVALNHADKYLNGGSSEFFAIPQKDLSKPKTRLIDGQYAPFGYVTEGYDLLATLKPGDVIGSTDVSEFGYLNLIRVRGSTFGDIIQSSNDDKEKEEAAGENDEEKK